MFEPSRHRPPRPDDGGFFREIKKAIIVGTLSRWKSAVRNDYAEMRLKGGGTLHH